MKLALHVLLVLGHAMHSHSFFKPEFYKANIESIHYSSGEGMSNDDPENSLGRRAPVLDHFPRAEPTDLHALGGTQSLECRATCISWIFYSNTITSLVSRRADGIHLAISRKPTICL